MQVSARRRERDGLVNGLPELLVCQT
nr:hypothetical protein BOSE7B_60712 [Bosea sp. 7B]